MNADPALKFGMYSSVYCACVISQSCNDGLQFKANLIRQNMLNMDAKFLKISFSWDKGKNNYVQNLKLSFIY